MARFSTNINKLLGALNFEGCDITYNTKQFKGREGKNMTLHWIGHNVWNEETRRWENQEIFRSTSMLRIVFYLRDMLFILQGKTLPTDQEPWNIARQQLIAQGNFAYQNYKEDF